MTRRRDPRTGAPSPGESSAAPDTGLIDRAAADGSPDPTRRLDVPLGVAAVLFLVAFSVPILVPDVDPAVHNACSIVLWVCWSFFGVDFLVHWWRAADRRAYVRRNWLDALAIVLPVFQPLRLVRLVALLRAVSRLNRHAAGALHGRVTSYVAVTMSLLVYLGALAVLSEERGGRGSIQTFGDALWWATVTVTTVGYGDHYPVTLGGRLVAVGLMVCGIALLGIVTASMAAWLIERIRNVEEHAQTATRADLAALGDQVRVLQDQVARLAAALADPGTGPARSPRLPPPQGPAG